MQKKIARGFLFFVYRNDIDAHEKVAFKIGEIFSEYYRNLLDDWREYRNKVDYSPYPTYDLDLNILVEKSFEDFNKLFNKVKTHLREKGVDIVC